MKLIYYRSTPGELDLIEYISLYQGLVKNKIKSEFIIDAIEKFRQEYNLREYLLQSMSPVAIVPNGSKISSPSHGTLR